MTYELMFRSGRTRPAHARSSGSEMLLHTRSLVGSIIDTRESSFWKGQASLEADIRRQRCPEGTAAQRKRGERRHYLKSGTIDRPPALSEWQWTFVLPPQRLHSYL